MDGMAAEGRRPAQGGEEAAGGIALPPRLRERMESLFGADLAGVRVHVGPHAAAVGARAFAAGEAIHLAPGGYRPDTAWGRWLLAHEAAHVLQQRQGRVPHPGGAGAVVLHHPALEAEADEMAGRLAGGHFLRHGPREPLSGPVFAPAGLAEGRFAGAVLQCVLWRWDGRRWVALTHTTGVPPARVGHFVGQTYDDRTQALGGSAPLMLTAEPWADLERTGRASPRLATQPNPVRLLMRNAELSEQVLARAFREVHGTGLDAPLARRRFAFAVCVIRKYHAALCRQLEQKKKTLEEVLDLCFYKAIAKALERVGVNAPVRFELITSLSNAGAFNYTTWTLKVNRKLLEEFFSSSCKDLEETLAVLADTFYHEARHAEQVYRVLRFLAGSGFGRREILEITEVPGSVVDLALSHPLRLPESGWTLEAGEAMRWYQSFFGRSDERRDVLTFQTRVQLQVQTIKAILYATALKKALSGDSEERRQLEEEIRDYKKTLLTLGDLEDVMLEEYKALAEEEDAWHVGGEIGRLLRMREVDDALTALNTYFEIGSATGVGNNCLLDTLYQLANNTTVSSERNIEAMRDVLVEAGLAGRNQMLDIYGQEGRQLLAALGIQVRVIQIVGGQALVHPVAIGTHGPLYYVLHYGNHFVPLRLKVEHQLSFPAIMLDKFRRI